MKKCVLLPQMTFKYIKVTDGYQSYCKSHSVLNHHGGWGAFVSSVRHGGWGATAKPQEPGWGHIQGGGRGEGGGEMILGSQAGGGTALS